MISQDAWDCFQLERCSLLKKHVLEYRAGHGMLRNHYDNVSESTNSYLLVLTETVRMTALELRMQYMCVWILWLTIRLMMASCSCEICTLNFTIGCILHPSWLNNVTERALTSRREDCHINVTMKATVVDTDNQFLLTQKVSTYRKNKSDVDLILIGHSPHTCSPRDLGEYSDGSAAILTLPCPNLHRNNSQGIRGEGTITSWLSPKICTRVWDFLFTYITAVQQNTIIVFYEENKGRYMGEFLDMQLQETKDIKLIMYSDADFQLADRRHQLLSYIHKLLYVKGIYGILLGSESTLKTFLQEINNFDFLSPRTTDFRHRSFWLVVTHIGTTQILSEVSSDLENIAIISPGLAMYDHDSDTPITTALMNSAYSALSKSAGDCSNMSQQAIRYAVTSHLKTVFQMEEWNNLYLHIAEGVGPSRHFTKYILPLNPDDILSFLFPNVKYGYNRRHIDVTILPWPGFMERVESEGKTIQYQGMCMEMIRVMQEALNFTYTLYENKDKTWGVEVNGSWVGMVGDLQRREADLALADVTIHYQRDQVVDYVLPAFKSEVTDIVYRKFATEDFSFKNLTRPFKPLVVLCIAVSLLFVMLLVTTTERINPYYDSHSDHPLDLSWRTTWGLLGSVLMQGSSQEPATWTARVLLSSWWLFCIVVAATYSATLIVSFAVKEESLPFKSLADLVGNDEYRWGMFDGSLSMLILTNSTRPEFQKAIDGVRRFAKSDPSVLSTDIAVQLHKVQTEKYALISSRATLQYMQSVSSPLGLDLRIVGESLYADHVALAVPTDSPLLPDFQRVMATISEIGLLHTWEEQWWNRSFQKNPTLTLGGKPITLANCLNALCLVAIGTATGLTALFIEYIVSRSRTRIRTGGKSKSFHVPPATSDHVTDMT